MPRKTPSKIPQKVKHQIEKLVLEFNEKNKSDYATRIRGQYVYFDRKSMRGPVFRLKFGSDMSDWEFAIYKYSSGSYDSNEWFFPGSELVNGTIEGAMQAGLKAYPV